MYRMPVVMRESKQPSRMFDPTQNFRPLSKFVETFVFVTRTLARYPSFRSFRSKRLRRVLRLLSAVLFERSSRSRDAVR